jgi:hypothetical protein
LPLARNISFQFRLRWKKRIVGGSPVFKAAYAMNKGMAWVVALVLLPVFNHAQDCCGPGGGGGASTMAASSDNEDAGYRLKNARHYAYSARHPGLALGLEGGGATDLGETAIGPRLEYSGSFGSFDLYGGAFYSVFFEKPHSHQIDIAENIAWRLAPDDNSRLVFRLDNEDLLVFFPDTAILAYAALDPGVAYSRAFGFGDLSLSFGLPVLVKPEGGLNSYVALGYEHPIGLGVSVCPRISLLPDALYGGTTFTLSFAWDALFVKAAFVTNKDFAVWDLRPYGEITLGHIVLWAGAETAGLGGDNVSISPFVGAGYHF